MTHAIAESAGTPSPRADGFRALWHRIPLYVRILAGVLLGVVVGLILGVRAAPLDVPSKLVLRLLGALAPPLILLAVIQALMHARLPKGTGLKLVRLLLINTLVAIGIGVLVANVLQPGRWRQIELSRLELAADGAKANPLTQFLDNIPKSLLGPLTDEGKVLSVVLLALAFGIALRRLKDQRISTVADVVEVSLRALLTILDWIIEVIPIAVFGIVAAIIGTRGFDDFRSLGGFVVAVLVALLLQTVYYLARIRLGCWARPRDVLTAMRDALVMAFSTGSSTVTMPVTYACLRERVGLREQSASLGALVGSNFNNDGTALYEAMSALFVSQLLGQHLPLEKQFLVAVTSVIASVGAAGIPEAGLVTMTLVFGAVGLQPEYIAILLTVDWFLDRCRTAVNVLGDVTVSCLLDGRIREVVAAPVAEQHELVELTGEPGSAPQGFVADQGKGARGGRGIFMPTTSTSPDALGGFRRCQMSGVNNVETPVHKDDPPHGSARSLRPRPGGAWCHRLR